MDLKGLQRTSLLRYNEIDTGDELHIPLKPFLVILRISHRYFYS
jgi:hypothetical protein